MSINEGWKLVSIGLCVCFQVILAYESIVLCKCSGKYIDIYFSLKITCLHFIPMLTPKKYYYSLLGIYSLLYFN